MREKQVLNIHINIQTIWKCNRVIKSAYISQDLNIHLRMQLLFMLIYILVVYIIIYEVWLKNLPVCLESLFTVFFILYKLHAIKTFTWICSPMMETVQTKRLNWTRQAAYCP